MKRRGQTRLVDDKDMNCNIPTNVKVSPRGPTRTKHQQHSHALI